MPDEKFKGGVKVMRSFDYCHFEVCLSSDQEKSLDEIDGMRKEAAKLVDKAVEQYAQFKAYKAWIAYDTYELNRLRSSVRKLKEEVPKSEWTPEQKASVKLLDDINFHREREYDYDDDWDDNYPKY